MHVGRDKYDIVKEEGRELIIPKSNYLTSMIDCHACKEKPQEGD
jgi:hypothetical protein